ncbi:hypothetical protein ACTSKR_10265 [Chitinibacteraceae bacterium HSL-7]
MKPLWQVLFAAAIALALLPATLITTLLLIPLWELLETRLGIASMAYSGPKSWCYVSVLALLATLATLAGVRYAVRHQIVRRRIR